MTEIERKFLIDGFPDLPLIKQAQVFQGYLCTNPVVRIRRTDAEDGSTFVLTFKGKGQMIRQETEMPITAEIYEELVRLLPMPPVRKNYRVYALPDGHRLECSLVDEGEPTSFWFAEVEFSSEEEARAYVPPTCVGQEITGMGMGMGQYWNRKLKMRGKDGC